MEGYKIGILLVGLAVAAGLFLFVDTYLAGIIFIIVITLAMAFQIMGETRDLPEVTCLLSEDARKITIVNRGTDRALGIHVTLVPLNLEFDLSELAVDGRHEVPLPSMIAEAKALVSYSNPRGRRFSRSFHLSATEKSDEDLLKPLFPTFGWK